MGRSPERKNNGTTEYCNIHSDVKGGLCHSCCISPQVLCSPEVWLEATASNSEQLAVHNVTALSLGMHWLKGVRSSIELFLCW